MKKQFLLTAGLAAFSMLALAACGTKTEKSQIDTAAVDEFMATNDQVTEPSKYAALFSDPSKKSAVATDSTYAETASGLKYIILREGDGASPKETDMVTVQYEGELTDGTVFDSSYQRGEPAAFPLNRVIPGWTEGLQLMKVNGKAVFFIPSAIGYGPNGAPPVIPPNADLIFTVELLEINK